MKIGLIGTGKMGKGIEHFAHEYQCDIVAKINQQNQNWDKMRLADLWIDFSTAELVPFHVEQAIQANKNLLIGTTNWENALPLIRQQVSSSAIGVLALPNCSIGLFIFIDILKKMTLLLSKSSLSYSTNGLEIHHKEKKDAPSGTAKEISKALSTLSGQSLHFESKREGDEPGFHQVSFSTPFETMTLAHSAKNREGFLRGAFEAALWLKDKTGFYTMEDYLKEVFCEA